MTSDSDRPDGSSHEKMSQDLNNYIDLMRILGKKPG
jgi:hypothetical protein